MKHSGVPKVAVAGAGAWGGNHVRVLHGLGALGGVVDTRKAIRDAIRESYPGTPVWDSVESAFPHVEGLVVATPPASHPSLAGMALEAGLGVLVEKPMTLDVGSAERLVELASRVHRPLMVGHLLLFHGAIQELKRRLDAGIIGRVFRIDQERLNHGRVRAQENVLWSFAPHDLAVLLHLVGEAPLDVAASGADFLQPGIHDDVHLELGFSQGRSAHVHASWYWPFKRRGLRVMGETGMLVYDEADQSLTLHRKRLGGPGSEDPLAPLDQGAALVCLGQGEPLIREDQHFLDCLRGAVTPLSDGRSGLEVIRILEQAGGLLDRNALFATKEHS